MKLKSLILPLAALFLAGCHHHDQAVVITPETSTETPSEDDYCYAKIQLFFPSADENGSRAGNDSFDYGLESENEIKNAILLLFDYDENADDVNESTFLFQKAYNIELSGFINTSSPSAVKTIKLLKDDFSSIAEPVALVIANNNGLFEVTSDNGLKFNNITVPVNTSLSDVKTQWLTQTINTFTSNGILMVNALGFTKNPGEDIKLEDYWTATPFESKRVYATEAEALNQTAAYTAYLERTVAKVCVVNNVGENAKVSTAGSVKNDLTYEVVGWKLINQNRSSFVMRQWQNIDISTNNWGKYTSDALSPASYRFTKASGAIVYGSNYSFAQFCISHGYDSDLADPYQPASFGECGKDHPAYCYENTFPVDKMMMKNATCALIKTQFKKNGIASDIYRIGEDYYNYYDEAGVKVYLCTNIANQYSVSAIFPGMEGTLSCENINFDSNITYGHTLISEITFKLTKTDSSTSTVTWTSAEHASELATLNTKNDVFLYSQGYAYYVVPIKHYGDELTPWNNGESTKPTFGKDVESAYNVSKANSMKNYLGRYGVVRNNSYVITLRSVKHLGLASDYSISTGDSKDPYVCNDNTPLDYLESNLKAEISILNWTNREEEVDLEVK